MPNTGTIFELRIKAYLQSLGYYVMRAAGSKGAFDLIAWNENEVLAIQCKKENKKKGMYCKDLNQMTAVPVPRGWKKQLWVKTNKDVHVHNEAGVLQARMDIRQINKVIKNSSI